MLLGRAASTSSPHRDALEGLVKAVVYGEPTCMDYKNFFFAVMFLLSGKKGTHYIYCDVVIKQNAHKKSWEPERQANAHQCNMVRDSVQFQLCVISGTKNNKV